MDAQNVILLDDKITAFEMNGIWFDMEIKILNTFNAKFQRLECNRHKI